MKDEEANKILKKKKSNSIEFVNVYLKLKNFRLNSWFSFTFFNASGNTAFLPAKICFFFFLFKF